MSLFLAVGWLYSVGDHEAEDMKEHAQPFSSDSNSEMQEGALLAKDAEVCGVFTSLHDEQGKTHLKK